jgi:hypothetical protein
LNNRTASLSHNRYDNTVARILTVKCPGGYPTIERHCTGCGEDRAFVCSGRFRANSNGKLADIWLIYRCESCESTYNLEVIERRPVRRIDRRVFDGAQANDPDLAAAISRDLGLLRRRKVRLSAGDRWELDPPSLSKDLAEGSRTVLAFSTPLVVRIDRLLASALGISRSALSHMLESGVLVPLTPGNPRSLRLWDGFEVRTAQPVRVQPTDR